MFGVPKESVLGSLLFLLHINDLPDGINSLSKIFADDTSFFAKFYEINKSVSEVNAGLEKISYWAYQCKMQFNPDPIRPLTLFSLENQAPITYHIQLSS